MLDPTTEALAEPDAAAKNHSLSLQQCIKEACDAAGGWISFADFMNISLYQPALGYYSSGLQKFGQEGDFITAPEVSPLFGQCLARQLSEVIQNLQAASDEKTVLLEFGAGSGILAADILSQLEVLDVLPGRYLILELSAELRQRQKQTIQNQVPHLLERVQWLDQLPDNLSSVVVIANEVLDAMPVECYRVKNNQANEIETLMIGFDENRLVSRYVPAGSHVVNAIGSIKQRSHIDFPDGYRSEYNPAIAGWLSELAGIADKLVMLLIDYGYNEKEYYLPDRSSGTLMCYYQHKAHADFLWWPGLQDITAFVNFTDAAYGAVSAGLDVSGYTTQAAFLLSCGLSELHASQVTDEVQQQIKLSQQIKTLTLPSEMGERFKVLALTKNYHEPLTGFSMLDLRNRL